MNKIAVTILENRLGLAAIQTEMTLAEIAQLSLNEPPGKTKDDLRMIKGCRLGPTRSQAGSLRTDANLGNLSAIIADYDSEQMAMQIAHDRLDALGIIHMLKTSASHQPGKDRWHLICPLSRELPKTEHTPMLNRLHGVLGGVLNPESWTLSQFYYLGSVVGGHPIEVLISDDNERYIDEADELDLTAIGKPKPKPKPGAAPDDIDSLDEDELGDLIKGGISFWAPTKRLIPIWIAAGVTEADAETNLRALFQAVPQAQRTPKWRKRFANIPRWIKTFYAKARRRNTPSFRAAVDYLLGLPEWRDAIRLNRFTSTIEVCDPFPPQPNRPNAHRALREPEDILRLLIYMQDNGFPKISKGVVWDVLGMVAAERGYHPVRNELERPKWDKVRRARRLFLDYFPCELPRPADPNNPTEEEEKTRADRIAYLEKIGESWMIGAVKRIFEPGSKVDHMPVIVGPQGWGKSRGLRALVPDPDWFTDDLSPNLTDKDTKDALIGVWIIELAEIPHLKKEAERVKAFFSRQTDRFRRAYDRLTGAQKRQCVFIGTSNDLEFADPTGNRRFWPVALARRVDVAAIERDRDMLWAEAVELYRSGADCWLSDELEATASETQAAYAEEDSWDGMVDEWLEQHFPSDPVTGERNLEPFSIREILEDWGYAFRPYEKPLPGAQLASGPIMTFIPTLTLATKANEARLARCLKRLGFRRNPVRHRRDRVIEYTWIPVQN